MHGPDAAPCHDKLHVLLHHVQTPFLVLADQEDWTISQKAVVYADVPEWHWPDAATYRAS